MRKSKVEDAKAKSNDDNGTNSRREISYKLLRPVFNEELDFIIPFLFLIKLKLMTKSKDKDAKTTFSSTENLIL